jgi:hypothetical protein
MWAPAQQLATGIELSWDIDTRGMSMTSGRQSNSQHVERSRLRLVARWGRSFFAALYPCRFALLAVVIPGIALVGVPQVQECLRALAERREIPSLKIIQWAAVFVAALYWAASAWYWTRQLLGFRFPHQPAADRPFQLAQALLPRVIGTAGLALLALSIRRAGSGYESVDGGRLVAELDCMALTAAGLAALFYLLVHFRRRLFRLPPVAAVARIRDLPRATKIALIVTTVITVALFVGFAVAPLAIAPELGAVAILLSAAAAWCTFGSLAVFVDARFGLPVLPLVVVSVLVFSLWNDNHALRGTGTAAAEPMSLEAYTAAWLDARGDRLAGPGGYPVVVVAAAGGGIRAAYWTGSLLAALQDRYGLAFSEHTFAISGVSGGSLGAATYAALLDDRLASGRSRRCQDDSNNTLQACANAVLSQDFLAPVVGSMLFPDLTQRFLPFSVPAFDRGRVLEASWEQAWLGQGLPNTLAQPFYGLWANPEARVHRPLLFLNSTLVESGERVIVSPVALPLGSTFFGARMLHALTPANLPLSAAAHLSARFTYVSPAASIYDATGHLVGHLVDGGYFENSGADTAAGIVNALRAAARTRRPVAKLDIRVLLISNAPGEQVGGTHKPPPPDRWMTEVLAPVAALLNAREARGWEAESAIERMVSADGGVLTLGLAPSSVDLPLGWTLSDAAQCEIDTQLAHALDPATRAPAVVELDALLSDGAQSMAAAGREPSPRPRPSSACQ